MTVTTTDNEHDFAFSDIAKCLFHLSIQLQSSCSPAAGMFLSYESLPSLYSHNYNKGLFLVKAIAFLTGHSVARYIRLLTPLIPLTRFTALHFATLAQSIHGLAHSLRSLPRGTVEILECVFTLLSRFTGTNAFLALTRNTPEFSLDR